MSERKPTFLEFFAGGGMVRLGLEPAWRCTFANDICEKKAASYRAVFGDGELRVADVATLSSRDVPGHADLAWASFPCQDLSLAGAGAGLAGSRSGVFKPFWRLMLELAAEGKAPRTIVLENVTGTLTSHGGRDFAYLLTALADAGYRAGALVIDAARFLPQSRPRLFVVGALSGSIPDKCAAETPALPWQPHRLRSVYSRLSSRLRRNWVWWRLPEPSTPLRSFSNLLESDAHVEWHSEEQTARLVELMAPLHQEKLDAAKRRMERIAGTVYRRTRHGVQRAEVRFDQVSGCLRTPAGGSSRQTVIVVEGERVRSRLLSAREAARLMGVPDSYPLPARYNDAYHLFGDGVAVPVAEWLSEHLLLPLAQADAASRFRKRRSKIASSEYSPGPKISTISAATR